MKKNKISRQLKEEGVTTVMDLLKGADQKSGDILLQYKDSLFQIADLLCEKGTIRGEDLLNELNR